MIRTIILTILGPVSVCLSLLGMSMTRQKYQEDDYSEENQLNPDGVNDAYWRKLSDLPFWASLICNWRIMFKSAGRQKEPTTSDHVFAFSLLAVVLTAFAYVICSAANR